MKKIIEKLERLNLFLNKILLSIAGFILVLMVLLACLNVLLRNLSFPIQGTFELMGFFGATIAAFSLGRTQIHKQHIAVDVLINLFPKWLKKILNMNAALLSMIFFLMLSWQITKRAFSIYQVNELSETLMIAYYPFVYAVAFGTLLISLTLLLDLLKLFSE